MRRALLLFLLAAAPILAQSWAQGSGLVLNSTTAPTGSCFAPYHMVFVNPLNVLYGCKNGAWVAAAPQSAGSAAAVTVSGNPVNGQLTMFTQPIVVGAAALSAITGLTGLGATAVTSLGLSGQFQAPITTGTVDQLLTGALSLNSLVDCPSGVLQYTVSTHVFSCSTIAGSLGYTPASTAQLPSTIASVSHKYLTSYTSGTEAFAAAQPASADLSDLGAASGAAQLNSTGGIAQAAFSGTGVSSAVSATSIFSPASSSLQVWRWEFYIVETTAGTGCTGSYVLTVTWTDARGLNSYAPASGSLAWASPVSTVSGNSQGTGSTTRSSFMQQSTTPPTFAIAIPSGCSGMKYEYAFDALRMQ